METTVKADYLNFQGKALWLLNKASENPKLFRFLNLFRLSIFIFYGIILSFFIIVKHFLCPKVFSLQLHEQIQNAISIIYGIVGAFVAIMVPLHYSLSFDILGEIEDVHNHINTITANQKNAERRLKHYCHTAEGLVYSFALFGALVLIEEAFVIAKILGINIFSLIRQVGIIAYFYVLTGGMSHNLRRCKEWELAERDEERGSFKYLKIYIFSLLLSGVWGSLLLVSDCHNLNAVIALMLVIGYYLLWIYLRHLFAPLSNMKSLIIPNKK
jgi:hypothetical protein